MATTFTDLQNALFDWGFSHYNDAGSLLTIAKQILSESNQQITVAERWPFRVTTATGTSTVTITDLPSSGDIQQVVNTAASNSPVTVLSAQEAQNYYDITQTGFPEAVYVTTTATSSVVKAVPVGGTLSVTYYKDAPALSSGTDEPLMPDKWRYLIATRAAWRLASRAGDAELAGTAQAEYLTGLQAMRESLLDSFRFVLPVGDDS